MNENRTRFVQTNRELYLMKRGWEFAMKTNDRLLPDNLWVKPLKGAESDLNSYTGESKKLVLVLSNRHCSSCIDQLLFTIKNEIPELNRNRILILFSEEEPTREQWNHRQKILPGARFLEIRDKSLLLPLDSLDIPYFFITGPQHFTGLTYMPYPSFEVQTKEYLNLIKQKYLTD